MHAAVEDQAEGSRGISFVDDVTWVVEGADVGEAVRRLEQCTAATLEWASCNAVRFEETKTEAILFSKKKSHHRCNAPIRVGDQTVRFAPEATRWLGIWLDLTLSLVENQRRRVAKTRQAEARLRHITARYGVPPAAARKLQSAIVQVTILCAAELTWSGKKGVEGEHQ